MNKYIFILLTCLILGSSGCASYINHARVRNNILETRIKTSGTEKQQTLLSCGMKPNDIIKISSASDYGTSIGIDLFGIKSYFTTFKEAPISSTVSLIVDAALAYYAADEINEEIIEDDEDSSDTHTYSTTDGNVTVININSPVGGNVNVTTTEGNNNRY